MVEKTNQNRLYEALKKLSVNQDWHKLKYEWRLSHIDILEKAYETCSCGHNPIKELCFLKNIHNDNIALVGNRCVNKFLDNIKSETYFRNVKKLNKDIQKSLTEDILEDLNINNCISEKSYEFYCNIIKKRNLTEKQIKWKVDINNKFLQIVKKSDKDDIL